MKPSDVYMVATSNFLNSIPSDIDADIRHIALNEIGKDKNQWGELIPDFIVFDPKASKKILEDDDRTLRIPMKNLPDKVYAKLDNYGSKEVLSEQVGHHVNTQYVLTFMMADDY